MKFVLARPVTQTALVGVFPIFVVATFLILFADAIMSYYFPLVVEANVNSNTVLGIIMGLSSLVGLICDLVFPQLFKKRSWKFLFMAGVLLSILFPIITNLGVWFSSSILFIAASIIWGVYFEFLSFSQQNFVVSTEPRENYSKDWGMIAVFWGVGMLIGPIVGSLLVDTNLVNSTFVIIAFQVVAFIIATMLFKKLKDKGHKVDEPLKEHMSIISEIIYWFVLLKRIWPPILLGLMWQFINATFWTIGALFGAELLGEYQLDWLIVFAFVLPSIPGSILLAKLKVNTRKKFWSEITLMLGGLFLALVGLIQGNIIITIILILLSGLFLAFAWPLNEAVYSDLSERAGKYKLHITAITRANTSIGYIAGPILAGILADSVGYNNTFAIIGLIGFIFAIILVVLTPKKLKIPQVSLEKIDEKF